MLAGHYSAALVAKSGVPRAPLWSLFFVGLAAFAVRLEPNGRS
jgi:hypothetical protein